MWLYRYYIITTGLRIMNLCMYISYILISKIYLATSCGKLIMIIAFTWLNCLRNMIITRLRRNVQHFDLFNIRHLMKKILTSNKAEWFFSIIQIEMYVFKMSAFTAIDLCNAYQVHGALSSLCNSHTRSITRNIFTVPSIESCVFRIEYIFYYIYHKKFNSLNNLN